MKSKYINVRSIKKEEIDNKIEEVGKEIKKGNLVLFPTETVYGIGANALSEEATKKIFAAKGRKADNPLIVHISNVDMIYDIVEKIGEVEKKLIDAFWPGPLTIIFKRKDKEIISDIVTAGLDTVGIRMPSNEIAKMLIEYSGVPIAAPSANVSGKPSGTNIDDIIDEFMGKVSYIIDDGFVDIGIESTVVKVVDDKVHILRPGKITAEQIKELIGSAIIDDNVLEKYTSKKIVSSPGMKYKHYAPNTKCILVYSKDKTKLIEKINEMSKEYNSSIVIGRTNNLNKYISKLKLDMGEDLNDIAKNIFTLLRKVDKYDSEIVFIEGVEREGMGLAITNRLLRACEYNYIEI